jgi:hypothetical protein
MKLTVEIDEKYRFIFFFSLFLKQELCSETTLLGETMIDSVEMFDEDENVQQLTEFGNWEIDDEEIKSIFFNKRNSLFFIFQYYHYHYSFEMR